jgi:tripartite-type tricarboxylate transporter receptor subunit TctC
MNSPFKTNLLSGGIKMGKHLKVFFRTSLLSFFILFPLAGLAGSAFSLDYPTQAITLVVGMEPGSGMDVVTRVLAEETKKILGRDVMVENKPGASHMVALSYVIAGKPDGYTLFSATDAPFVRAPHLFKLKFDPIAETVPIIFHGILTHFMVVPADSPFKTLKDMLIFAKQNPGKLTVGNPGFGTVPYVTMAGVGLETGLKFSHVPFAGEPKEIAALLGGHVMAAGIAIDACIAQVQAGKLRILGVLQGDKRLSAFPDIPTLKEVAKEFGMKSSVIYPGLVIAAKKGVPGPIVEKLANVFNQARMSPGYQKYVTERYIFQDGMPLVGEKLQNHLNEGYKEVGELIQKLGIEKK